MSQARSTQAAKNRGFKLKTPERSSGFSAPVKAESAPHEAQHYQDDRGEAPHDRNGSLSQAQHGFLEQLQLDL
jgi:hypothetical protein